MCQHGGVAHKASDAAIGMLKDDVQMKRSARLTNAHSKKIQNQMYAFAIQSVFYNFARIHQTLRITPAVAAGISDHVWGLEEIVSLAD